MSNSLMWLYLNLCITTIITVNGYLDQIEIPALNNLYTAWNGKYWSYCKWNMSSINDTSENNFISNHCGLYFGSYTTQNNSQYVRALHFRNYPHNNITGTIPVAISNLKQLRQISLFYNELHGTIPKAICNLTNLNDFLIYGNDFNGALPDCLFDLPNFASIAVIGNPQLSLKSSNIQQICNNMNHDNFEWLQLRDVVYYGSIPQCIGYNLTNMYVLQITGINSNLTGSIPSSLNNLIYLQALEINNLPGIETNTKTYLNLKQMTNLFWIHLDLSFVDIELLDLCELDVTRVALTNHNESNLIHFPNTCIFENNNLNALYITGYGFNGTVDELLCMHNETLSELVISNTKYVKINIPNCIVHFHQLTTVKIANNTQLYSIPAYSFNSSYLFILQIENNKNLKGQINNLLTENSFHYLQVLAFHNNNFYDTNINNLLNNMFYYSNNLIIFTLHGNKHLSGKFPEPKNELKLDNLAILTLHNLD
eukprot:428727_1